MASTIGPLDARQSITGLATHASVSGPRGALTTEIVSHGGLVRFVQVRGGQETALLVAGTKAFVRQNKETAIQAADGPEAAVVHGHDLHRLLLDLPGRVQVAAEDATAGCVEGTSAAGRVRLCRETGRARPARLTLTSPGAREPVVVEFSSGGSSMASACLS